MTLQEIRAGESKNVEFKEALPEKSIKYMKSVVAFANSNGGKILFGIEDDTCRIIGINDEDLFKTMDSIANAISDSCEPAIYPDIFLQTIEGKTIIVVDVPAGKQRPYYIKSMGMIDGTYVRVAGTTRTAEGHILKELILEGRNRYFDSEVCPNISVSDADIDRLCRSMKETAVRNTWQDSEKASIKEVSRNTLISWGILKEENGTVYATNAYALLTGQLPEQPVIQCGVFKGKSRAYFVDRSEFGGPLQEQMESAYRYVLEKINMGMTIKGMYRQDRYELPTDSIRELIANAVAHRSYLEPGNIQAALFDDRLEVTSPGMLLNNVTIPKIMAGYSKLRNPAIVRAFVYMKIIESWGTGIPRLLESCAEYGLPKPELLDFGGDFRVNLYRKAEGEVGVNGAVAQTTQTTTQTTQTTTQTTQITAQITQRDNNKLTDDDRKILELVKRNPFMSQADYAKELDWPVNRVKYYLRKLKAQNFIRRVGNSHSGHWEVMPSEKSVSV